MNHQLTRNERNHCGHRQRFVCVLEIWPVRLVFGLVPQAQVPQQVPHDMIDLEKVKQTLDTLRDVPADTNGAGRDILALLTDFLLDSKRVESSLHWFCHRADKLAIDAATFLLRLHAYDSETVQKWRQYLVKCLGGCCECVRGLEEAKISSRHT
jgi:senataxin